MFQGLVSDTAILQAQQRAWDVENAAAQSVGIPMTRPRPTPRGQNTQAPPPPSQKKSKSVPPVKNGWFHDCVLSVLESGEILWGSPPQTGAEMLDVLPPFVVGAIGGVVYAYFTKKGLAGYLICTAAGARIAGPVAFKTFDYLMTS